MASNQLRLSPKAARSLIFGALTGAGTRARNAGYFADAILDTELSGLEGHGFYWLQYYCEHVSSGKVDGKPWNHLFRGTLKGDRIEGELLVSDGDSNRTYPWTALRTR